MRETLEALGMPQVELAKRTSKAEKTISEIVNGKAPITAATALAFERALGVPAAFWNRREQHYREYLARTEEKRALKEQVEWLKEVPVAAMIRREWVGRCSGRVEQLREVLSFFGMSSVEAWKASWLGPEPVADFRSSPAFERDPVAVAAWLRQGELLADKMHCGRYDVGQFRSCISQARALTTEPQERFVPRLKELCSASGVAFVLLAELPRTRVSGAARWLSPSRALLQLSLRHGTNDHFWFSFFHEAAHILLHGKKEAFVDEDQAAGEEPQKEREANSFSEDQLIPKGQYLAFATAHELLSKAAIVGFADRVGVAPGIVVGRLQHEGRLPYTHCNDLKAHLDWGT